MRFYGSIITAFFIAVIGIILSFLALETYNNEFPENKNLLSDKVAEQNNEEPIAYFGTPSLYSEAEDLYRRKCASCHKIDQEFVGPALLNTRDHMDFQFFKLYVSKQDSLFFAKDSLTLKNRKKFPIDFFHKFELEEDEYESLYYFN